MQGRDGPLSDKLQPSSKVLLEEMQQHDLVVLSRLWAADAVSLIWVNL